MTAVEIKPGRYSCPVCPKRYVFLSDKKAHIKIHHSSTKKAK